MPIMGGGLISSSSSPGTSGVGGGVTELEGLLGVIDLDSPNGSIDITTSGQVINFSAIFTSASGALLEQKCRDIDTLSGLIGGGAGNPVDSRSASGNIIPDTDCTYDLGAELARWRALYACSGFFRDRVGVGTTTPPTSDNAIETLGNIRTSGHVHPLKDCIYNLGTITDRWANLNACSGTFSARPTVNGSGVLLIGEAAAASSASGASIELFFTPLSGTSFVLEHGFNSDVFTWDMWSTEFDPIRTIHPTNVYPSGNNHVAIELDLSASGRIVLTAGGTGPQGPQGPRGPLASGACSVHNFEPSNGTLFVVTHALNTENFTWSMWNIDSSPFDRTIVPTNVAPSGANHAIVELDLPMSGKLVIQGCSSSGISVGDIIAARTVSDSYTATNLDAAILVDASTGPKTITLLNPSGVEGKSLYIKKIDASSTTVTLNANGSGLIDGDNTAIIVAQYDALRVTAHNGNWWIL